MTARTNHQWTAEPHSVLGAMRRLHMTSQWPKWAMQMTANAGGIVSDKHNKMPGLKHKMWANEDGMANMESLGDFSDECYIHFNDTVEDAFIVQEWDDIKGKNIVWFPRNCVSNSHSHKFPKAHLNQSHEEIDQQLQMVNATAKNCANHSMEQYERAKRA